MLLRRMAVLVAMGGGSYESFQDVCYQLGIVFSRDESLSGLAVSKTRMCDVSGVWLGRSLGNIE